MFEIHIQHFVHDKYFIGSGGSISLLLALVLPLGPTHRPLVRPRLVLSSLRHHRVSLFFWRVGQDDLCGLGPLPLGGAGVLLGSVATAAAALAARPLAASHA